MKQSKNINDVLVDLSNTIYNSELEYLENRLKKIINFIRRNGINKKFSHEYIGSYSHKTSIKLSDNRYDIDVAFKFENITDDELKSLKKLLHSTLYDYREQISGAPSVSWRTYAISLDFSSDDSNREYHFDFTLYNEENKVVKGKQDEILTLEKAGVFDINNDISNLSIDVKERFKRVVMLLKHWNVKGKGSGTVKIPSIVFTNEVLNFMKNDWDGTDSYLRIMHTIIKRIIESNLSNWKLDYEPYDNPFARSTQNKQEQMMIKLRSLEEALRNSLNTTDLNKKFEYIKDYFPNLQRPIDNSSKSMIENNRRSANKGA